jgi:formamidopyrimidine-DNA glycosylase
MPELPEVETIRRQLAGWLPGRTIATTWSHPSGKFSPARHAEGATITELGRRGKYLLVGLEDGRELVIHLGMTGVLRPWNGEEDPYVRARWHLDDGSALELRDVRRFGRIQVTEAGAYTGTLAALGPEPLAEDFTAAGLYAAVKRSSRAVKTQLLSQIPVAGIGNIYADEALWLAGVHPAKRQLTKPQATALHDALVVVIGDAIDNGGTTLRDYRTPSGESGDNQNHLLCYGQAGLPCQRCGTELRRIMLDARSTTFCPACQRLR